MHLYYYVFNKKNLQKTIEITIHKALSLYVF